MKKEKEYYVMDIGKKPNVLLLGNGLLRLGNKGISWEKLLKGIKTCEDDSIAQKLPFAMRPEALCGVEVEKIQNNISKEIENVDSIHPLLKELLQQPFDAILTTNYTYEIEEELLGTAFSMSKRKKAFTDLNDKPQARLNTFICNTIKTPDGRKVPVFHIHGEKYRKSSLVLSYYSYAKSLSLLTQYNKQLGNSFSECEKEEKDYKCKSWLDYFLLGNVWSVGFGLDVSEFDIWWAIERKAREKFSHGFFKAYFPNEEDTKDNPQKVLLEAMKGEYKFFKLKDKDYASVYREIIDDIETDLKNLQ